MKDKNGKIRLLYEAYPSAHIFHIGCGFYSNGKKSSKNINYFMWKI